MDRRAPVKILMLFILAGCASCKPVLRALDICTIPSGEIASCAIADKQYTKKFPLEFANWYAFPKKSLLDLGNKLQQCDADNGHLPVNDKTWEDMKTCQIVGDHCGDLSLSAIEGFYSVSEDGAQKIRQKLDWCRR